MQEQETIKILSIIKVAYPQWGRELTPADSKAMVSVWSEMLKDHDFNIVQMATKKIISTNKFPPAISEVLEACRFVSSGGQQELTEQQAWGMVRKAISNSAYHAEEQYNRLPEIVQKVVGSPSMLRAWGREDVGSLDTVIASNFMRSYKASMVMHRENEALPSDIKTLMLEMQGQHQQLLGAV